MIALIRGRDLAPESTEQEFPLQTVLGQLTCEITLLHMDLWQNITEADCTTFTRENGLHFLAECCKLMQRSNPLLAVDRTSTATHAYLFMTKKKPKLRKVPYFQQMHTMFVWRCLSSAVVNVFAWLPRIFNAQFATAASTLFCCRIRNHQI